ncbi:non-specific lipid-transfer protein-like protein [Tanacetum coccineum]
MAFRCLVFALAVALCSIVVPVYSQINIPCSPSMITSFTPCLSFLSNSTTNGTATPTTDCCNSLKSLTSGGTDCLCPLFVTREGEVCGSTFQIPINQSLAISLPRACKMPSVPLQCKAPAPIFPTGPAALVPAQAPGSSSTIPEALSPTSAPESDKTPSLTPESDTTPNLTPPTTGVDSGVPTTNAGSRPTVTPSAAASTDTNSPFILAASGATGKLVLVDDDGKPLDSVNSDSDDEVEPV